MRELYEVDFILYESLMKGNPERLSTNIKVRCENLMSLTNEMLKEVVKVKNIPQKSPSC